ncbi:helix-turn-helix domain-containing protein [Nocardia sp. CC201C]|uniref:IclR family transcriptional regulator n=1 Tax=Nocardia sp. CC201C TaxID=3044575 RepID=UPI0024A81F7D|nr:helix-turn-helix domain-containing protein [Nocardia sp. CC201C]
MTAAAQPEPSASPPTQRVVRVIDLLSRRPAEHLSLAAIVRATGMSRATAHAVLTQLTADGWTLRDDSGNYSLGLELVTVARRAEAAFPLRRLAADPMRKLAAQHDIPVFLAEREADAILVTEVIGTPSVPWIRVGRRLPLAPPVCREFVAWAPAPERDAWIAIADPSHRPRLSAVLDAIRTRGYAVERLADDSTPMLEALSTLRHSPVTDPLRHRLNAMITDLITIDYLPDELTDHNAVVSVAAPIFGTNRATTGSAGTAGVDTGRTTDRVAAAVVACPDTNLTAAALEALATDTMAAAAAIAGGQR